MKPIPFLRPCLPDPKLVARDYEEIFTSGVFTNGGARERAFADALALRIAGDVGVSTTSSATTGIQLACRALFALDRPYALIASFTFAAGPLALRWCGFEPVFLDIERDTWQPDLDAAEQFLVHESDGVAGILLTNTFGTANDSIERWEDLARRFGLPLVIDSAAGFASEYSWGEVLGARGDCEIFSLHATKIIGVGEGGAISARDRAVIEHIDRLKNFGFDAAHNSLEVGTNAKLTEIASAIGLRQLEALPGRLMRRREVLRRYADSLRPLGVELQPGMERAAPPFVSAVLPTPGCRDLVGRALEHAGVGWRTYYNPPAHRQQSFAGARSVGDLSATDDIASRVLSLPLHDDLSSESVARIAGVVASEIRG